MSKYTTTVRWLVEQYLTDIGKSKDKANWHYIYEKLGLNEFDMWGNTQYSSEENRKRLCNKIIQHYWFREIGFETAAQFAWEMNRTMQEIMPYYNQMYESESLKINPLLSFHEDTTNTSEWNQSNESETNNDDKSRNVYQDTPMGMLSNSGSPSVENLDYATNVTYDDSSTNEKVSSASNGTNDMVSVVEGWRTNQSKLLQEYRKTFLNIDQDIIEDLETLFMGLW